ncbi:MAG: hypothetical protein ACOYS2_01025 [Patescibacteria group bacterium]
MLSSPINFNQGNEDEGEGLNKKEVNQRKRHELDREKIILESDHRRANLKKGELEMEIRKLRKDRERLDLLIEEKEAEMRKMEVEISDLESQLNHLNKQMNILV